MQAMSALFRFYEQLLWFWVDLLDISSDKSVYDTDPTIQKELCMSDEHIMTLKEATTQYLNSLKDSGRSPRTLYTYGKDCEQILAFFGPDKKLLNMLPAHVAQFYKSDELLKIPKTGKDRAPKTVNKTKMVFKGLLSWAKEHGHIEWLPLPKKHNLISENYKLNPHKRVSDQNL